MGQIHNNRNSNKYKHLTFNNRLQIEALVKAKHSNSYIANFLGVSIRTIQRELKRGLVQQLSSDLTFYNSYSADIAQKDYDFKASSKGSNLKLANNFKLASYIDSKIKDKFSPVVISHEIKSLFPKHLHLSHQTIYNYIYKNIFLNSSIKDLIYGRYKKKKNTFKRRISYKHKLNRSIELRDKSINKRLDFGHWEMDIVVGKRKKSSCLLVLTERKSRLEIIRKIDSKTQYSVIKEINKLERMFGSSKFKEQFKSITVDNGSEFLNANALEKSLFSATSRTKIFYAHPFSSGERGSNENQNRIIRRFIPKGCDITNIPKKYIKKIEDWMNNYPRKLLNFQSPLQLWNSFASS